MEEDEKEEEVFIAVKIEGGAISRRFEVEEE